MDERLLNKSCLVIKTIVRRIKLLSCFFGYFMEWDDSKTLWRLFSIWKVPNFDRKSSIVYQSCVFWPSSFVRYWLTCVCIGLDEQGVTAFYLECSLTILRHRTVEGMESILHVVFCSCDLLQYRQQ